MARLFPYDREHAGIAFECPGPHQFDKLAIQSAAFVAGIVRPSMHLLSLYATKMARPYEMPDSAF